MSEEADKEDIVQLLDLWETEVDEDVSKADWATRLVAAERRQLWHIYGKDTRREIRSLRQEVERLKAEVVSLTPVEVSAPPFDPPHPDE